MARYIPPEIAKAAKQGFSAPDSSWFKGESIDYVRKKLMCNNANLYEYFDPAVVQSLVGEHFDGKENRRLLIWSLLNFEHYLTSVGVSS